MKEEEKDSILKKKSVRERAREGERGRERERERERENNEGREKDTHRAVLMNYLSNYLKGKNIYTQDSLVTELTDSSE